MIKYLKCLLVSALFVIMIISISACSMADDTAIVQDGSTSYPYRIDSAEDLNALRGGVEGYEDWDLSDNYILTADIDLSGFADWVPLGIVENDSGTIQSIEGLSGSLDGNGHSITSLTISRDSSTVGLFAQLTLTGVVENLTITGADITGRQYTAILVGSSYGTISDCRVEGTVKSTLGGWVGGLAGANYGTIAECSAAADISSLADSGDGNGYGSGDGDYAGGFVGYNDGSIDECYAEGDVVTYDYYAGGFVGYQTGTISNSYSLGDVTGSTSYLGGFAGYSADGSLTDCYSSGVVSTSSSYAVSIKGFVGVVSNDSVSTCYYNESLAGHSDDYAISIDLDDIDNYSGFDTTIWALDTTGSVNDGMAYLTAVSP